MASAQQAAVIQSWNRFESEFRPHHAVLSWTLVCPWDPTPERRAWLNELTSGLGRWLGRAQLDVLASERPNVIDFYLGDGNRRTQELMALALRAGPVDGADTMTRPALLDALLARTTNVAAMLDEVDPFYRYEVEVRTGQIDGSQWADHRGAKHVRYITADDDHYLILRIYPLSAESHWLRPISFTVQFQAFPGTPEHDALDQYRQFGAPFDGVLGTVTQAEGPPGAIMTPGEGVFSILAIPLDETAGVPEVEFRVLDGQATIARIDLVTVELTAGADGPGQRIAGRDRTGILEVEAWMGVPDRLEELRVQVHEVSGAPREILAVANVLVAMPHRQGEIGIRDGLTLTHRWDFGDTPDQLAVGQSLQRICRDLLAVQAHSVQRVRMPATLSDAWIQQLRAVARVIAGEIVALRWDGFDIRVPSAEIPEWVANGEFTFARDERLQLTIDNDDPIETDVKIRSEADARIILHEPTNIASADTMTIRLLPGADPLRRVRAMLLDDEDEPWSPQMVRFSSTHST